MISWFLSVAQFLFEFGRGKVGGIVGEGEPEGASLAEPAASIGGFPFEDMAIMALRAFHLLKPSGAWCAWFGRFGRGR